MLGWTTEKFNINGKVIEIPFAVIGTKNVIGKDGVMSTSDINQNIHNYAKKSDGAKLMSELQTQYMHCVRTRAGIKIEGHDGPLFVSNDIPEDCFALHHLGGIIINEKRFADARALDSDGDRGLLVHLEGDLYVLIKYPLTKLLPVLRRVEVPVTSFTPLTTPITFQPITYTREELVKLGRKVLIQPLVGPKDNKWDQIEAREMSCYSETQSKELPIKGSSYYMKTCQFLKNEDRFNELEGLLKSVRKEGKEQDEEAMETTRLVATPETAWVLGFERGKNHLSSIEFDTAVHNMRYLNGAAFEVIELSGKKTQNAEYFPCTPSAVDKEGLNTVQRLMKHGLISITKYPHVIPSLSFSVVRLYAPNDKNTGLVEVALTTTDKREQSTMGYLFVIPPIIVREPDGGFTVIPIELALDLHISSVDCYMPNAGRYWPRNWKDVRTNPIKAGMLENKIRDFVSKYGWSLYYNNMDVETNAAIIAANSIFIHFQSLDSKIKSEFLGTLGAYLNSKYSLDIVPNGGDKKGKSYTKISVAKPNTFSPVFAGDFANPKRACQAKTPLANSTALKRKAILVITGPYDKETNKGTSGQLYATRKGQELCQLSNVFLNRFSTTKDDDHTKVVYYYNFAGQKLMGYIAPPQATSPIAKLITPCGMKNMVQEIPDNITVHLNDEWQEPDYLLSIDEINAKGALNWLISRGLKTTTMTVDGVELPCAVIEIQYYRTTTPSECVMPGKVKRVVTGMERHALAKVLMEHELPIKPGPVDREYVDILFNALQDLKTVVNYQPSFD